MRLCQLFLLAYSIESSGTIAISVLMRRACGPLTRPASATRADVQSLVDEEVALSADHL